MLSVPQALLKQAGIIPKNFRLQDYDMTIYVSAEQRDYYFIEEKIMPPKRWFDIFFKPRKLIESNVADFESILH